VNTSFGASLLRKDRLCCATPAHYAGYASSLLQSLAPLPLVGAVSASPAGRSAPVNPHRSRVVVSRCCRSPSEAATSPRLQSGAFFRCALRPCGRAVASRLQRDQALAARRSASPRIPAETPSPGSPPNTATLAPPSLRSRRAGPCQSLPLHPAPHPALSSLTATPSSLHLSRDEELRGTAAASRGAATSAKHETPGLQI
jgi:hypothetical protein